MELVGVRGAGAEVRAADNDLAIRTPEEVETGMREGGL
jgi:hypothetical protein